MASKKRTDWKTKFFSANKEIEGLHDQLKLISDYESKQTSLEERLANIENEKRRNRLDIIKVLSGIAAFISILTAVAVAYYSKEQTKILSIQTDIYQRQTKLLENQDSLISVQNELFNQQNLKFDLQNVLVGIQNDKTDAQNKLVHSQNILFSHQNDRIDQQTNLQEAERRSSLVFLFNNVLDKIDEELKNSINSDRELSPQLIGRISALSHALKPYKYLDSDSILEKAISPERGQLLLSLVNSNLGRRTLDQIFSVSNFKNSEIREINLSNQYFKGIDLSYSNLENTDLSNSVFEEAIFEGCYMKEANIQNSVFNSCMLIRSDLQEVKGAGVVFKGCIIHGSNFSKAILLDSKFQSLIVSKVYFGPQDVYLRPRDSKEVIEEVNKYLYDFKLILGRFQTYELNAQMKYMHQVQHHLVEDFLLGSETLWEVDFSEASLTRAIFGNMVLRDCDFSRSLLYEVKFNRTVMSNSYFDYAKIDKTTFKENFLYNRISIAIGDFYSIEFDEGNMYVAMDRERTPETPGKMTEGHIMERFNMLRILKMYPPTYNSIKYVQDSDKDVVAKLTRYSELEPYQK